LTTALAHAIVLTLDADRRILVDGAVAFDAAGTLLAVGPTEEVLAGLEHDAAVLDLRGRVIAPGFVDSHVHLGEQLARGLVPDEAGPFEWLPEWLLPMYAALAPEEERLNAELAIAEMLLTGTTTFCEAGTLLEWEVAADVVAESGIRAQLGRWTWDLPDEVDRLRMRADDALRGAEELVDAVRGRGDPRISPAVILWGLGTCSEELMREAKVLARDRGVPLAMMWASVAPEHGGPVLPAWELGRLGWLDSGTKLTHAVYLGDEEVRMLARHDVRVAHCPTAALRHIKGISRHGKVPEMLAGGMSVGLGADSANGSNYLDMLRVTYLAATLYKDFRMDPRMISPETALEMATLHGARCLGLEHEIGSLEPGKRADLVVFSTEHPEWRPLHHPVQNLVLNASDRSIESVWVDGRKLVENGELLTIDLPRLLERSDAAGRALLDRIGMAAPSAWPRT
jgi:5-methylthioadenosine/S-adenosylhomocysteine deaminase